jgi:hypothetical protein
MNLRGQTVYLVCSYDQNDVLCDFKIFADHAEALRYETEADKKERRHGGHAYTDTTTIN